MKTLEQVLQENPLPFDLALLQVQDITNLAQYSKVGWFLEVGTGKTVCSTVLAMIRGNTTNLVIMPPILIPQWKAWLELVDPGACIGVYYGPKREAGALDCKWVLTSHGIFRNDYAKISKALLPRKLMILVDEAQALKNVQSKLYKYVKMLSAGADLQLLTATPTSVPDDAYSYISLKTPGIYRSKGHFENLHAGERDFFKKVLEWKDLETISANLHLQATKRTKEEMFAGMLNPPVYQTLRYDLAPAHLKLYEQLVDECILDLVNSGKKIDASTPQLLYHATQQMILNYDYFADDPAKMAVAFDMIDEVISETGCLDPGRSKLILWTYYKRSTARVLRYVQEKYGEKVAVAAYSGADSAKSVRRFMTDSDARIMAAQPTSVGVGLNAMTVCWEALFLEFSAVSMHIRQSIGRVDRVGQLHIPNIRFGVANNTCQVKLLSNLFKRDDEVSVVERNPQTLREALLGR